MSTNKHRVEEMMCRNCSERAQEPQARRTGASVLGTDEGGRREPRAFVGQGSRRLRRTLALAQLAALVIAGGLAATSCGKTETLATGESHFLRACVEGSCGDEYECLCGACTKACDDDAACSGASQAAECVTVDAETCGDAAAVCDVTCGVKADCASLGTGYTCVDGACRGPLEETEPSVADDDVLPGTFLKCDDNCSVAKGYPIDQSRGCVDMDAGEDVGCVCEGGTVYALGAACAVRKADGSAWSIPPNMAIPEGEWTECNDAQEQSSVGSCDFSACEEPPPSLCSMESTCERLGCGGFEFDEAGCGRKACETDANCSAEERCTAGEFAPRSCMPSSDGTCTCSGLDMILYGSLCNPVSVAGPRGAWQRVTISESGSVCEPPGCAHTWTLTPDGAIAKTEDDTALPAAQTDEISLQEMELIIDGLELRPWLESGGDCSVVMDWGATLTVELEGTTLRADVSGCVLAEADNAAVQLYAMITQF